MIFLYLQTHTVRGDKKSMDMHFTTLHPDASASDKFNPNLVWRLTLRATRFAGSSFGVGFKIGHACRTASGELKTAFLEGVTEEAPEAVEIAKVLLEVDEG